MARGDRELTLKVVTDVGSIKKDVAEVNRTVGNMGKTAKAVGAGFVAAFAVDTVIDFAKGAIGAASDLAEAQSKVNVVFEDGARDIQAWARTASTSMGLSETAALGAAGTFGNLFDAMGLTQDASVDMSKGIVQLAADLGSFNNVASDEVLLALQSGLLGEAEPMRRFGSALSAARVEAHALATGMAQDKSQITEAIKVQARYELILQDTVNAQGDFARTSDGMANKTKTAAAKAQELNVEIGKMLAPLGNLLVEAALGAMEALGGLGDAFHDLQRFMSPHLGVIEDQRKELLAYAESVDADVESLQAWLDVQDAAREAARQLGSEQEDLHRQARLLAADFQNVAGVWADAVQDQKELEDQAKFVTEQMRLQGYVVNATGDGWVRYEDSVQGALEKTTAMKRELSLFGQSMQAQARFGQYGILTPVVEGTEDAPDQVAVAVRQVAVEMGALVGITRTTLRTTRDEVRVGMAEIRDALVHPFRDDNLERTYRSAVRRGTAAMNRALKTGNEEAYAEARDFVRRYKAKLRELRDQRFRVRVSMFVDAGNVTGPGAVLLAGMAGAGLKGRKPRKHAMGLDWVPYDNYPALLHRGERVLDAKAADRMDNGGGSAVNVNVSVNAAVGADGYRTGSEIATYLDQYLARGGRLRHAPALR